MSKRWRSDQDRNGSAKRRRLEFNAVTDQIKRRRVQFMKRLQSRLVARGECLCYRGTLDQKGYARLNVSYWPDENKPSQRVTIGAHRLFLILKLGRPIKRGYEAGHLPICQHRTCVKHLREEHYKTNASTAVPDVRENERAAA
jgi:hypothetical protein